MNMSGFMQHLPDMWGDHSFWTGSDRAKPVAIDETTACYWTNDSRELYVKSISLPNDGEAVVVSAIVAQFRVNAQSERALIVDLHRMKSELTTCCFNIGDGSHGDSGCISNVYVSQITVIRPAELSDIKTRLGSLKACIKQTDSYLRTLPEQYEKKLLGSCSIIKKPKLDFIGQYFAAATAGTMTLLQEAIVLRNRPADDGKLIDFTMSLARATSAAHTGFRLFGDGLPKLDMSLLPTQDTISFEAPDSTEITVTRMSGVHELFFIAANACRVSIFGMTMEQQQAFFDGFRTLFAPLKIEVDNVGNVVLFNAFLTTECTRVELSNIGSNFWKDVLKIRKDFTGRAETSAGRPLRFEVHSQGQYPLPQGFVENIIKIKRDVDKSYADRVISEMADPT